MDENLPRENSEASGRQNADLAENSNGACAQPLLNDANRAVIHHHYHHYHPYSRDAQPPSLPRPPPPPPPPPPLSRDIGCRRRLGTARHPTTTQPPKVSHLGAADNREPRKLPNVINTAVAHLLEIGSR